MELAQLREREREKEREGFIEILELKGVAHNEPVVATGG